MLMCVSCKVSNAEIQETYKLHHGNESCPIRLHIACGEEPVKGLLQLKLRPLSDGVELVSSQLEGIIFLGFGGGESHDVAAHRL